MSTAMRNWQIAWQFGFRFVRLGELVANTSPIEYSSHFHKRQLRPIVSRNQSISSFSVRIPFNFAFSLSFYFFEFHRQSFSIQSVHLHSVSCVLIFCNSFKFIDASLQYILTEVRLISISSFSLIFVFLIAFLNLCCKIAG